MVEKREPASRRKAGPARKRRRLYEAPAEESAPAEDSTGKGPAAEEHGDPIVFPQIVTEEIEAAEKARRKKYSDAVLTVRSHMGLAMSLSLLPGPIVDVAAVTAIQLKMLAELSDLYGVPFRETRVKALVAVLIGGVGVMGLAQGILGRMLKSVPLIGPALRFLSFPTLAGAATYATGKVFLQHYELGGTLLDFCPETTRTYFAEQFQEGRLVAEQMA